MARLRNTGRMPDEAAGKRIRVWFSDGREGRCDDNAMSPPGWAADGRGGARWSLTGSPFDIAEFEIIQ